MPDHYHLWPYLPGWPSVWTSSRARSECPAAIPNGEGPHVATHARGRPRPSTKIMDLVPTPVRKAVDELGGMAQLLYRVINTAVLHPRGYWADVRDDMFDCLRRAMIPLLAVTFGYGLLASTFAVSILTFLGAPNRLGSIYLTFAVREIAPFITAVVVSGVLATKTTSDIGARKIREELDALRVLGQDPVRLLVLPRVISLVLLTILLNYISVIVQVVQALYLTVTLGGASAGSFIETFLSNVTIYEVLGNLVKAALMGLCIGIVSTSKGLAVTRGAEGVGRAVNQAVVICIISALVINSVVDVLLLSYIPELTVLR